MMPNEVQSVLSRLRYESDTAVAILGAAWLDSLLEQLLEVSLVADREIVRNLLSSGTAPIGAFSSRIDLAYCLGRLPNNVRRDLHVIRRIRNDFAHKIDHVTFRQDRIRDLCSNLDVVSRLEIPLNEPRVKFVYTVAVIALTLQQSIVERAGQNRTSPEDYRPVFDEGSWATLDEAKAAP